MTATKPLAAAQPLAQLPIDRLRKLAKEGPDAATRAAAQREIDARSGAGNAPNVSVKITTTTTEYGTPQPEMRLLQGPQTSRRELHAAAYECAAKAERALARSSDAWVITLNLVNPDDAAAVIVVELIHGTDDEAARAVALLHAIAPVQGPKKRGRKAGSKPSAAPAPRKTNGASAGQSA